MLQEPDHFGDQELILVYIAKRLKEALALEELLTRSGVDYLVEPDEYVAGTIFRRNLTGAFFYVAPEQNASVRQLMIVGGYKPWVPENE